MKIDTNKDGYDELHILAADARASRRRTNIWTTGLIVGGMIAASAYVSTTNDQVGQLKAENVQISQLKAERDKQNVRVEQLRRERDFYKENTESLREALPALKLSDAIAKVSLDFPDADTPRATNDPHLANLIWIVDGSRRFPLSSGDILWIPEGGFWIEYVSKIVDGVTEHKLFRHDGARPGSPDTEAQGIPITPVPLATSQPVKPYRIPVRSRGASSCLEITLHPKSNRPGFSSAVYVDIEVLYKEGALCSVE